jgi:hypothetical protein
MMRKAGQSHASRLRRSLAIAVPSLALIAWPGWCRASSPGVAVLAAQAVGSQPRLERLSAATRVSDTPPEGWSHLVIRSVPRLASGEWRDLPEVGKKTATMFRTVIVADVQPLGIDKEYILSRVGIAMCVPPRDGKSGDVVVSSDRLEALGMRLSTVEQVVLQAAETELAESRIIAWTSTFALLRSPVTLLVGGKHRKVDLYYAFCVDPTTGRMRVGVWSMWPGDVKKQPPPPAVIDLAPKTTFDCELDVQAKRVLGTVPYSWDFAIRKLPPGRAVLLKGNKVLGEKIVTITKHPNEVDTAEFERMLRAILFPARDAAKAGPTATATTDGGTTAR